MRDLSELLSSMPGHATACVVHRPGYAMRYAYYSKSERWRLCKSAYAILVERTAKLAQKHGRKLAVYVEGTGPNEDKAIREYHISLREAGMIFNPETSAKYNLLQDINFKAVLLKRPRFYSKKLRIGQLADLLLYPLIKGRYDATYKPYQVLRSSGRILDSALDPADAGLGVKYYCFDP